MFLMSNELVLFWNDGYWTGPILKTCLKLGKIKGMNMLKFFLIALLGFCIVSCEADSLFSITNPVERDGKWNFYNSDGGFISTVWYDEAHPFTEGYAVVRQGDEWNFIDRDGNLFSTVWFEKTYSFTYGFAVVKLNGEWNFVGTDGTLLFITGFYKTYSFVEGFGIVRMGNKWRHVDTKGNYPLSGWLDYAGHFHEGYAKIRKDGRANFIDTKGNLLLETWVLWGSYFIGGFAVVTIEDSMRNCINLQGEYVFEEWIYITSDHIRYDHELSTHYCVVPE